VENTESIIEKIKGVIEKYQENNRVWYGGELDLQINEVIRHYQDIATDSLAGSKSFRDDMLTYMRALAMITEMAANAATHAEKNARLRGMIELIESTIQKLRDMEFNFQSCHWRKPDVFRSDYPVLQYIRRIHELEHQIQDSQKKHDD